MSTTSDVTALYQKYLNRPPTSSELALWVDAIDNGDSSLLQVEIDIKASNEYKVVQYYLKHLHLYPDSTAMAHWLGKLPPNGTTNIRDLEGAIAATNEAYIVKTFNEMIGRDPTRPELDDWAAKLAAGQLRSTLNTALSTSDEIHAAQVKQLYNTLLDRDPSAEIIAELVSALKNNLVGIAGIREAIIASEEYKAKVTTGTTPTIKVNPSDLEFSLKQAYKQLFGVPLAESDLTFKLTATTATSSYSCTGKIMADDRGVNYSIALGPDTAPVTSGSSVDIQLSNGGTQYRFTNLISHLSEWTIFQVYNGSGSDLTLNLSVVNVTATVNTAQTFKQYVNGSWVDIGGNSITMGANGSRAYVAVNIVGGWTLKGVAYWINQFNTGAATPENIQSIWTATPEYQLVLVYKSLLNRLPDANEFAYWTNGLTSANLSTRIGELTTSIKAASEYKTANGGTDTEATDSVTVTSTNSQTIELETKETRAYVFTYVSVLAEESAPSDPVIVDLYPGTQTVTLTMESPPTGNFNLVSRRIYRSVTSTVGTNYYFVDEIPIGQQVYEDKTAGTDLAEPLPSLNWAEPPADLKGLIAMPNGFLAGFTGRDIYFSEAYHLHAWPIDYMQSVDYPVIGLGQFGQSLVVVTTGSPYLITGTDPSAMTLEKLDFDQSCVSARSISRLGSGVAWASPDGLAYVGPDGMSVITDGLFTRKEWQALNPSSIIGAQHDNRYYGFYDNGTKAGFVFDPKNQLSPFVSINQYYSGLFNDLRNDALYGIYQGTIKKIEGSTTPLSYTWRSKKFSLPNPINFSAWQVIAEDYNDITAKFYMDGTLIHTAAVTSDTVRRLPAGVRDRNLEIELTGTSTVLAVNVADRVEELRNV